MYIEYKYPLKGVYSYKPLHSDSKGRCEIQTAFTVHHAEFLGPEESVASQGSVHHVPIAT